MLFHNLAAPHTGVNIEQIVFELEEELEASLFERAWQCVAARHAALRTSFQWEGRKEPRQVAHREVLIPFERKDLRHAPAAEQQHLLQTFLETERRRGFDPAAPPLMRLALFRLSEAENQLVWTFHHALLDGRSFPLVIKEVLAFYEALRRGERLPLPPARPYRDFIQWRQEQDFAAAEPFWRERLKGFTAATPLVLDRPFDPEAEWVGYGEQFLRLPETLTARLENLARDHQFTLNTLVQGAWALLLGRYSDEEDVVFGATRACRAGTVEGAESIVGLFINTLPVRVRISPEASLIDWLKELRAQQLEVRPHEHTPLLQIQQWSELPPGTALFESLVVFERATLDSLLRRQGGPWARRHFRVIDQTSYPLTLFAYAEPELLFKISYDRRRFDDGTVARMLGHLRTLLERMAANPREQLAALPLLTGAERQQLLVDWNQTQTGFPSHACIHSFIEAQARNTPDAIAVVFEDRQLTYGELDRRANQLAHYLRQFHAGPEVLVGLCLEVSLELAVGLLGVLKAGAAYVPLDPSYPKERLRFILSDSRMPVVLTQKRLLAALPEVLGRAETQPDGGGMSDSATEPKVICLDALEDELNDTGAEVPASGVGPENLAYVIYTSGSTGKPKGVMVTHRNVVNFFAGMDERIGASPPGVWLAVTSISFDISVLELLWTLARGFKVVLHRTEETAARAVRSAGTDDNHRLEFSLFYFASDESAATARKYHLLLEGAKFADEQGFAAVWTPERHFHAFGGLYPNPSVTSAAIATMTRRLQIRAGSVVLPLHNPIRVAEEWAVVDNLSNGRVGISFAAGWQINDFVLAPENYARRKDVMLLQLDLVRKLWRGEPVTFCGPDGKEVAVRILPRPVQRELPVWLTAAGNPDTFKLAGELGANLLTHLLGQSVAELAEKIALYREAWKAKGHPGAGRVTLMLHTFVGETLEAVRERVRQPLIAYLRSSIDLIKNAPWTFPAFRRPGKALADSRHAGPPAFSEEEMAVLSAHAFDRYFETSGLFGPPQLCRQVVGQLQEIGVDEIACLIDFGIEADAVIASLKHLDQIKQGDQRARGNGADYSLPAQIARHGVTHLQCTPSLAAMLARDPACLGALRSVRQLLLGGEALPPSLAQQLALPGELINMYGPTETTVWSTTHAVRTGERTVPIGRPIANTQIYLVDQHRRPVPIGVPGQLLIGGAGVARGYLNRPELTAEKFIPHPFDPAPGARLYCTGDVARYLPDGRLELLGRLDHQVKIRGYRIELGEIEAVLNEHPTVQECVVIAREDTPGDKRLVAYVVPRAGQPASATPLRNYMKETLPEYMVPAHVVTLDTLPHTPNNKIDRKALPPPEPPPETGAEEDPPRTAIEEAVAAVWAETLGLPRIGRHENFFQRGGHSIAAVQVICNIRQTCNVDLPLQTLFQAPTVAAFAAKLEEAFGKQARSGVTVGRAWEEEAPAAGAMSCPAFAPGQPGWPPGSQPPSSLVEGVLARIWAEMLQREAVDREENFFALGGNSLLAMQLVGRLREVFQMELPLQSLFQAPTISQLARYLIDNAPRPELVEQKAQAWQQAGTQPPAQAEPLATPAAGIPPRNNPRAYPLSTGQQRLWFLDQLEGGIHYNDHFHLRLTGPLQVPVLERVLAEILSRHEVMRARFENLEGEPVQQITPPQPLTLSVVNLRELPAPQRLEEAMRLAVAEARVPFDLERGPTWRFQLLALADDDHILLITAHHIAIDGWSRGVFLRELNALYEAFAAGRPSPLPPLPIQYADFAAWQNDWLKSEEMARQLEYWKKQIRGAPALLELPTDRPRPAIQSFRGARHFFTLPKPLRDALQQLSRQEGGTLFMGLLAAFQALLQRYTGQEDFVVGSPIAGRNHAELEGLIGYFLNLLALRADLTGDPTFRQLLGRVRDTVLGAFGRQELPLEELVEALQPERTQSYNPLFQVMFVLQNAPIPPVPGAGLSARHLDLDNGTSKFDLTFSLMESEDGLTCWMEYATDLFDAGTIAQMAGHYQVLLEGLVAAPDKPLSQTPLLTPAERQQVVVEWNRTEMAYPKERCIHELFEAQAERTPEAVALEFGEQRLTYRELNHRANQLAHYLQRRGVGPETLVGICLERSPEMLVGLLGIMKAGGAYVPLDPYFPPERLEFMLEDARLPLVLTQLNLLHIFQELQPVELPETGPQTPEPTHPAATAWACIDAGIEGIDLECTDNPVRTGTAENLAYVLYTSGSTGRPKGVQIPHRAAVNFLSAMREQPGITAQDTLLAVTTLSFDIAGLELLLPLTVGARVVIAPLETARDGKLLAQLLARSNATLMQATPAGWRMLLDANWPGQPGLKALCGGEAWNQELAQALLGRCHSLWNMYGPTETTIWSAVAKVEPDEPVLVGTPIANTQFYVLDSHLEPVAVGVPGELHIGGDGLARGYLNRPTLTAEKFVPSPFATRPGARLYKTGDLVRHRPDGRIEFLGRIDHQVKLRGFRIELGEIEAVLGQHEAVQDCVVLAREDTPGDRRLVAYVVPREGTVSVPELRRHLKAKLPDYMVPGEYVLLERLPRTPNGKLDRRALPAPERTRARTEEDFVAPQTPAEQELARIWTEVLGTDKIGRNDDFFALGGHSLLITKVISRIRKRFEVELPVRTFFESPTVAAVAGVIEGLLGGGAHGSGAVVTDAVGTLNR